MAMVRAKAADGQVCEAARPFARAHCCLTDAGTLPCTPLDTRCMERTFLAPISYENLASMKAHTAHNWPLWQVIFAVFENLGAFFYRHFHSYGNVETSVSGRFHACGTVETWLFHAQHIDGHEKARFRGLVATFR